AEAEIGKFQPELNQKKCYCLVMFPYPSGDKLHLGHWYNYGPTDSWARFRHLQGYQVFEPMGYDAFGLPAENYAIKTGIHPKDSTASNIQTMTRQLKEIGMLNDWDMSLTTADPSYYKWTQWMFIQLYRQGLAYKKKSAANWCQHCQTVLANEQAQGGVCERCDNPITHKELDQWFFKITNYAEELLQYEGLNWPEKTILMQRNWIGRSEGVNINFPLEDGSETLVAYTTRPDTIYSVTFICLAPEHPLVKKLVKGTKYEQDAMAVAAKVQQQTDIERAAEDGKDKFGAFLGVHAINPVNGAKIPVYAANFALMYGTGIVMADAHDQRDFEFARKYDIPLLFVISADGKPTDPKAATAAYTEDGILFNSGDFSGMQNREALPKMAAWLEKQGLGTCTINYRLRDWCVSRQRYWGAPIPIIYCDDCGEVLVPEKDLPVVLPEDVDFKPTGESPLVKSKSFHQVKCPKCGRPARRESDTMDTFVCSSWYFLRYPEAHNEAAPFTRAMVERWLPVDCYVGGPEHACLHLLYARFFTKALADGGFFSMREPFKRLIHQGIITKDGAKMSKSKGNVVAPDAFLDKYGSDVFRLYMMFMGPYTDGGDWNDSGISGMDRFVQRIWNFLAAGKFAKQDSAATKHQLHKTIKKCTHDLENFEFNTAIASLMELFNHFQKEGVSKTSFTIFVILLAPLTPHFAETCWEKLAGGGLLFASAKWPEYSEELTKSAVVAIAVQVNGKHRATITLAADISEEQALAAARQEANVAKYLEGKAVIKEIFVPGRMVSLVVK
ncbi:MAG: leucine--tRNA ligase, partial [Candidatus Abawacabacteria bacterium RIFCSPHIGHO2_01_FULL_46_8]